MPSSCQIKLLITKNTFSIVQRATAQSKIVGYGVAEASPGFQAGLSDCIYIYIYIYIYIFSLSFLNFYMLKGRIETKENRRKAGGVRNPPR
jgi:hypothetical protein